MTTHKIDTWNPDDFDDEWCDECLGDCICNDSATVKVAITLKVPNTFTGVAHWGKESSIDGFVSHWLTEGYFIHDYIVELPGDIRYMGYEIEWPKGWQIEKGNKP